MPDNWYDPLSSVVTATDRFCGETVTPGIGDPVPDSVTLPDKVKVGTAALGGALGSVKLGTVGADFSQLAQITAAAVMLAFSRLSRPIVRSPGDPLDRGTAAVQKVLDIFGGGRSTVGTQCVSTSRAHSWVARGHVRWGT